MNPRALTLQYLSWCPGVKAASQFLPDREIPSTQVAMMLALASMISLSGYYITNMALSTVGFPSYGDISITYDNPILAVRGNEIYLAVIVNIGDTLDFGTRYTLCLAKMSLEGGVSDVFKLVDTPLLLNYDMLVTKDGRFYLAYTQNALAELSKKLIVLESNDGRDWDESVLVFSDYLCEHSLTETKDGRPFLFIYSIERLEQSGDVHSPEHKYSFSTYSGDEWAPFEECPYGFWFTRFSSATDRDGNICIAGLNETYIQDSWDYDDAYMITGLDENGEWVEPRTLKIGDITNVEFREPDLLYSTKRDGFYFAFVSYALISPSSTRYTVHIRFSRDLVDWDDVVALQPGSDPSMVELPDGTIVAAFKNGHSAQEIHFSKSLDGVNWTKPQKVEDIPLDDILGKVVSWRRNLLSSFSGASLGIYTFIALVKKTSKPLFKQR
jgi:hypothetical protein